MLAYIFRRFLAYHRMFLFSPTLNPIIERGCAPSTSFAVEPMKLTGDARARSSSQRRGCLPRTFASPSFRYGQEVSSACKTCAESHARILQRYNFHFSSARLAREHEPARAIPLGKDQLSLARIFQTAVGIYVHPRTLWVYHARYTKAFACARVHIRAAHAAGDPRASWYSLQYCFNNLS